MLHLTIGCYATSIQKHITPVQAEYREALNVNGQSKPVIKLHFGNLCLYTSFDNIMYVLVCMCIVQIICFSLKNSARPNTSLALNKNILSFAASSDFENTVSLVQFGPGEVMNCYNQTIIDDTVPEFLETFDLVILANSIIMAGNQSTSQITIIDDDIKGDE